MAHLGQKEMPILALDMLAVFRTYWLPIMDYPIEGLTNDMAIAKKC
jgi:hypothetical protein